MSRAKIKFGLVIPNILAYNSKSMEKNAESKKSWVDKKAEELYGDSPYRRANFADLYMSLLQVIRSRQWHLLKFVVREKLSDMIAKSKSSQPKIQDRRK